MNHRARPFDPGVVSDDAAWAWSTGVPQGTYKAHTRTGRSTLECRADGGFARERCVAHPVDPIGVAREKLDVLVHVHSRVSATHLRT